MREEACVRLSSFASLWMLHKRTYQCKNIVSAHYTLNNVYCSFSSFFFFFPFLDTIVIDRHYVPFDTYGCTVARRNITHYYCMKRSEYYCNSAQFRVFTATTLSNFYFISIRLLDQSNSIVVKKSFREILSRVVVQRVVKYETVKPWDACIVYRRLEDATVYKTEKVFLTRVLR